MNKKQYLGTTSGNPLRGLIQDHVVTGIWMTCKDTFFIKGDYQQIVFAALRPDPRDARRVLTVPPAIHKPKPLWTGKQVVRIVLWKSRYEIVRIKSNLLKNFF